MDRLTERKEEYIHIKGCKTLYMGDERNGGGLSDGI